MHNRTTLGIISLCLGVFVFSAQDAIIKHLSGSYPVTQAVVIRSLVALPILALLIHRETGLASILSGRAFWLALRATAMFVSYTGYYLAFPVLPLAEAVALFFVAPLFITVMAIPVLKENVGWRSWAAIFIGLAGVVVILQPGSAVFEPAALLPLVAAFLYGVSALMARRLGSTDSASVMTFYAMVVYFTVGVVLAVVLHLAGVEAADHPSLQFLVRPWVTPSVPDFLLMGACGVIAAVAMTLITHAYRVSQANIVTSFEYSGVLWAPLWGFLFFTELPSWATVIGAALIVGSGLLVVHSRSYAKHA